MKKVARSLLIISAVLLVLIGGYIYKSKLEVNKNNQVKQLNVAYIKFTNQKDFIKQEFATGENALDLTKKIATVVTNGEGENAYVTTINGKEAKSANKEFWAFYVNGVSSRVGAGSYQLKNSDKIEWKIERY